MFRYQNNAFRILGLTHEASIKEIMQHVNEIKVKKSLGIDVSYEFDFSWMGNVDRSEQNVINALQRLENPISRLKEEIFWFWIDTDTDREALYYLIEGDRQSAHKLWKSVIASDLQDNQKVSALVNQMILSHSSVIGREINLKYKEGVYTKGVCPKCNMQFGHDYRFCIQCGKKLREIRVENTPAEKRNVNLSDTHWKNWRFAINRISLIAENDLFWERTRKKAEIINDPLLSTAKVNEMRSGFFNDIVNPNFRFIAQSLFSKDYERTRRHAGLLNGSSLPNDVLRKGFSETLNSQISLIKRHCITSKKEVSEFEKTHIKPIPVLVKIYSKLEKNVADPIKEGNLVDFNCISDFGLARDSLANDIKNMAIILNNLLLDDSTIIGEKRERGFQKAYEMIKKAYNYANSQYTKQKFEKDEEVIKRNMEMEGIEDTYYESPSTVESELDEKEYNEPEESASKSKDYTTQTKPRSSSGGWWKAFLLIVGLFIIGGYFFRG